MNIDNLNKEELVKLRQDINNRLQTIEVKSAIKPDKESILSLQKGDKIFGIRLSLGGHRLEDPIELEGCVDIVDYCYVAGIDLRENSETFRISISHPTKPFGISTTLNKEKYITEYCYLSIDLIKTGYDGFYTLKPENWKEDLIRVFNKHLEIRKKVFEQDLNILNAKINLILESEKLINQYINI